MDPKTLPIYELEQDLVQACKEHSRIIIQAPTGSGKSTQIPQMLLDHGLLNEGHVTILQPRRIAARMLSQRVARERQSRWGGEVGYHVRFEKHTGPGTRIRYVTEGILLRQMLEEPTLDTLSMLIFDEFHERHLYTDVYLACARTLQERGRPDLKLIVMSATLDTGLLEKYLGTLRYVTLSSQGRGYPVTTDYLPHPVDFRKSPPWKLDLHARCF